MAANAGLGVLFPACAPGSAAAVRGEISPSSASLLDPRALRRGFSPSVSRRGCRGSFFCGDPQRDEEEEEGDDGAGNRNGSGGIFGSPAAANTRRHRRRPFFSLCLLPPPSRSPCSLLRTGRNQCSMSGSGVSPASVSSPRFATSAGCRRLPGSKCSSSSGGGRAVAGCRLGHSGAESFADNRGHFERSLFYGVQKNSRRRLASSSPPAFSSFSSSSSCDLNGRNARCSCASSSLSSEWSRDRAPTVRCRSRRSRSTRLPAVVREEAETIAGASSDRAEEESSILSCASYEIGEGWKVEVEARRGVRGDYRVAIVDPSGGGEGGLVLHWAINDWALPPREMWTEDTNQVDEKAVQTPFRKDHVDGNGLWQVKLTVDEAFAPQRLVFVLRKGENWFNNGTYFTVDLKPVGLDQLVDKVIAAESTYSNWSLFNRFLLAMELLDGAENAGSDGMAFIFTWLRLSANRQLDWYRNSNYQSKDIAHAQKTIATRMMWKARVSGDHGARRFARMAMATLPRGGGDSEQIRMGILHIMRQHGIREGHRPGLHEPFLEEWHQKLHTNTTPEDITICEAYLHFLHTGSIDEFYSALWNNGGISREWLSTMDHPIRSSPAHLPHLIPPFQHFLWILKTVHAGADLDVMLEMSKGFLDDDLKHVLYSILGDRDAWWVPGKIVEARKKLEHVWRSDWATRDVLLLDIALDNFFGLHMSRIDKSSLSGDDLCELAALILENGCIASESEEIGLCLNYWLKVKSQSDRWSKEWAMLALTAVNRVSLGLQAFMDEIYSFVQPHAERFGLACNIQESYITNFGEEVVRGHPLFQLSMILQRLEPMLRSTAGLSNWQVSSQAVAHGVVMVLPSLASVQGEIYDTPQIAVVNELGGMEDIPMGVVGVLTSSITDVLSHVAIRARNAGVLLATCFNADDFASICRMEGRSVKASGDSSGRVQITESALVYGTAPIAKSDDSTTRANNQLKVAPITKSEAWAIPERKFCSGVVGGKAGNIAGIRAKLPITIKVPPSMALPFGTFERVVAEPVNADVAVRVCTKLDEIEAHRRKSSGLPASHLEEVRELVETRMQAPIQLREEVARVAADAGLQDSEGSGGSWDAIWHAICKVWASKWTSRAWLARRAQGFPDKDLYMGCLVQKVVRAEYAFVIHTVDPTSKDTAKMFCEVVPGLGEALVGNYPGYALSFTVEKGSGSCQILSLPSKRFAIVAKEDSFIVRSDSNGEDLEDFAGAGLYESVIVKPPYLQAINYVDERLIWDPQFRDEITRGIARVGKEVEDAMGGTPQDIEGVFANGEWTIVQVRPQVL